MKLYAFPPSPRARKVMAVIAHLGLPVELEFLDLLKGKQREPDYLKLNPNAKMPTLVDGDYVLWESEAIMQYLAAKKPSSLVPDDPRLRADIARWQFWNVAHWDPACGTLLFENFVKKIAGVGDPDPVKVKDGETAFRQWGAVLDAHLAKTGGWVVGSGLTLVDFSLAAPLPYAAPCRMPWGEFRNIQMWYEKVAALDAWKKSEPSSF